MSCFAAMGGAPSALLSKPWRELPVNNHDNLHFVKTYRPKNYETNHLRILLHGPVGAGKSSFINSVESVLHDKVCGRVPTDANSGSSFTKKYTTYKILSDGEGFYSLVFNDIMGFEQRANSGVHVEDVIMALRGHVNEDYLFNPQHRLMEGDLYYNSSPTLNDRVHVLVSVIPADSISLLSEEVVKKMREVRLAASDMRIPQLALLTKVDEACPEAKNDIKNVYKSRYLKEQVDHFRQLLGLPLNCIFLVQNYETETSINDGIDKLILIALKQMINYGEDFLNNQ